jgi:muramoyltetrapeptide carboxypeptidase
MPGRLLENLMFFARTLRAAGLPIGPGRVIEALRAVETVGIERRDDLYWTLHSVFVNRQDQRPIFDQAFHVFWRNPKLLERMMAMLLPSIGMPEGEEKGDEITLLEKLDFDLIAERPKILVGCSDITSLLTAITDRTGLVTFHGPMAAKDIADGTLDLSSWINALHGAAHWNVPTAGVEVLRAGKVRGQLYGGCLSMLVASLGTPYEIRTEGTILFIEDVAAKPFQIDRMLMHLKLAGKLDGVRGIICGEMLGCIQATNQGYTLEEVIMRVVGNLGIPVAYGVRSGHVSKGNITLPIGVSAVLNVAATGVALEILEPATNN